MLDDPRHLNRTFDASSVGAYLADYAAALREALTAVDVTELERARAEIVRATNDGKRVYAIGNGGSASIADHLCCDLTKGTHHQNHKTIRTQSLNANVALYSAIANDYGFDRVFSTQLNFFADSGDVLIAISSSGGSPNILAAVEEARRRGVTTIGLSGFSGGKLREVADICIYIPANNYGIVEDSHQAIMHILAQYIVKIRDSH